VQYRPDACQPVTNWLHTASTLVTPVNPQSGGPSVDGNWELATPYPSAPWNHEAPDPCKLTTFVAAWVDAPKSTGWYNPNDGLSQWISPLSDGPNTVGGWYVYQTEFLIPPIAFGNTKYNLTVTGKLVADDQVPAIFLENPATDQFSCKPVVLPALAPVEATTPPSMFNIWVPFSFEARVVPDTSASLYVMLYNIQYPNGESGNYTGLRLEFTSANFTPE